MSVIGLNSQEDCQLDSRLNFDSDMSAAKSSSQDSPEDSLSLLLLCPAAGGFDPGAIDPSFSSGESDPSEDEAWAVMESLADLTGLERAKMFREAGVSSLVRTETRRARWAMGIRLAVPRALGEAETGLSASMQSEDQYLTVQGFIPFLHPLDSLIVHC